MNTRIRHIALANAVRFDGKASVGAVLGKIISEDPKLRTEVEALKKTISCIVEEVNKISCEKQLEELQKDAPELLEESPKPAPKGLKPLPNAEKGKVIMRFAPSPSGPLHIGHAYVLSLNSEYCRMYNGKLIIRIEDTNPSSIYEPAYKMIEDEAQWVTDNNVFKVVIQSERLGTYYDHCHKLIEKGGAYVCTCDSEEFKKLCLEKKECPCRSLAHEKQVERYHNMFVSYEPGEAVVRMKTDMRHKNPAMRDFPLMRINEDSHPRVQKKHRVWPLMNLAVAIDDHEMGITHTIRAKDHMDNERRQKYIYDFFEWIMPEHIYVGRINFEDLKISASESRRLIEEGVYSGWDDIRLPFFSALQRRGFCAEALRKYAIEIGITQTDKSVTASEYFTHLNALNKDIIDSETNRYFFIPEPVEIIIEKAPKLTPTLKLHPEFPKRGKRTFETHNLFYISEKDFDSLKTDTLYRLMDCFNFRKKGQKFEFHSLDVETYRNEGEKILHWLPVDDTIVKVRVEMPDATFHEGYGEGSLKKLRPGLVIQFERFGFCRFDRQDADKLIFWFLHK